MTEVTLVIAQDFSTRCHPIVPDAKKCKAPVV